MQSELSIAKCYRSWLTVKTTLEYHRHRRSAIWSLADRTDRDERLGRRRIILPIKYAGVLDRDTMFKRLVISYLILIALAGYGVCVCSFARPVENVSSVKPHRCHQDCSKSSEHPTESCPCRKCHEPQFASLSERHTGSLELDLIGTLVLPVAMSPIEVALRGESRLRGPVLGADHSASNLSQSLCVMRC